MGAAPQVVGNLCGFGLKKNLTEINHKVSVPAKGLQPAIAGAFAQECAAAALLKLH